jgi:hypothetical protein
LSTHNDEFKLDRRYWTGAIWTRKLISLLWKEMRAQWDLRNADRHGSTKEADHDIRHARLLKSITALHRETPHMLASDRDILARPIPAKIRHPATLELWLKHTRDIVNRSTADATATIHRTHERLQHYFQYRRKKKNPPALSQPGATPNTIHITQPQNEKYSEKPGPI